MKYYKISEQDLANFLTYSYVLNLYAAAGVDNWDDGGMVQEHFKEDCKNIGLDPDDSDIEDIVLPQLSNYEVVSEEE